MTTILYRQQFTFKMNADWVTDMFRFLKSNKININASEITKSLYCDCCYDVLIVLGEVETTDKDDVWNRQFESYLQLLGIDDCQVTVIEVITNTVGIPGVLSRTFNALRQRVCLYRRYRSKTGNVIIAASPLMETARILQTIS